MQRLYHKRDADSPLAEVPVPDLGHLVSEPGYFWLDLLGEDPDDIIALGKIVGIDRASLAEAIDVSLLPRTEEHERFVYVVLNGLTPSADNRLKTTEIDLFVGKTFLVTIHRDSLPAVEWLQSPENAASTTNLDSPAQLTAFIAQLGTRRYLPLTQALDDRIEVLEEMAMASDPRTLSEVHALRRDVGLIRRTLAPQRDVFNELAESIHPAIDPVAARAFDRVFDHHLKLVDSLDNARALLSSVLETHRGAVADQTNEIIRVLTVFSAILLPMSVVAGMWGMNFIEVPLADETWGFWALVGLMLVMGLGLWLYFGRRRFVGGPRLKDLPRSVGLGLIQIGSFPIKVVSTGARQVGKIVTDVAMGDSGDGGDGQPRRPD
ncbi:MAG TPA: magnesium transporter CorA family protein [Acidimicrobiia bacterium]